MKEKVMKLKEVILSSGKKITILGHDNADFDSVVSALLLAKLFRYWKVECEIVLYGNPILSDTKKFLKEVVREPIRKFYCKTKESSHRSLFLVDHYQTNHSGNIIGCIDHHVNNQNLSYPFYYVRPSCSTAFIIYELMKIEGYPMHKKEVFWTMVSMVTDTSYFLNGKTVKKECEKMQKQGKRYDLFFEKMEKYGLSSSEIGMFSWKKMIYNGAKDYTFYEKKVRSSYIQIGIEGRGIKEALLEKCLNQMQKIRRKEKIDLWLFIVYDCRKKKTDEYKMTDQGVECKRHTGIMSRGTDIMPKIEEEYCLTQ